MLRVQVQQRKIYLMNKSNDNSLIQLVEYINMLVESHDSKADSIVWTGLTGVLMYKELKYTLKFTPETIEDNRIGYFPEGTTGYNVTFSDSEGRQDATGEGMHGILGAIGNALLDKAHELQGDIYMLVGKDGNRKSLYYKLGMVFGQGLSYYTYYMGSHPEANTAVTLVVNPQLKKYAVDLQQKMKANGWDHDMTKDKYQTKL